MCVCVGGGRGVHVSGWVGVHAMLLYMLCREYQSLTSKVRTFCLSGLDNFKELFED